MKKDESMMSLMTEISSDASTAFPDPADLGSVSCPKQHNQEMEEGRQDTAIVQNISDIRMEPSAVGQNEKEQHQEPVQSNDIVSVLNSFFCFGDAPLPQLTEEESSNDNNDTFAREQPIKESVECIYNDFSDMALIRPVAERSMESMSQAPTSGQSNHAQTAKDTYSLPPLDTRLWPQAPLLFRAAPNSGTEILGVRRDDSEKYLWTPKSSQPWWKLLDGTIKDNCQGQTPIFDDGSWILPINNGTEAIGESLVIDFQSRLFQGSLMIRLRDAPHPTESPSSATSEEAYFTANPALRFQVTIRGKFRESLQWSNLLTGLRLRRKLGRVPSKWFLWTLLKVVHFFAPQLQTKIDGDQPYALSPLGSAPRTVTVNSEEATDLLGVDREEPTTKEESLTGKVYPIKDPLERARARKKEFDQRFQKQDESFSTGVRNTYSFQFLQHLLDYHTSSIDLGSFHRDMNDILGGQPFQVMAEHNGEPLWMFEIWNESMLV